MGRDPAGEIDGFSESAEILSKEIFYSCEITEFMSDYGENSEPKEGIWLRNRVVPPLPWVLKESLQSCLGRRLEELDRTRQSHKRASSASSEFGTPRGKASGNMEAAGVGVNRIEGLPRITTPTAQIERLRTQPHLNTTSVSASPIGTRAAPLGKAGMTGGFTKPRVEPDAVYLDREAQHTHTTSTPINHGKSPSMARRMVVNPPPRFEGKNPRQWLSQISCYYDSLGLEDDERLEDVPAFLIGKALSYWCSIDEYAPELRPVDWEGFKHLMLARFSGQTVGSTIAKLQRLRYNGDFEL